MGLDNYWVLPGTDTPAEAKTKRNTGWDCSCFRGKLYNHIVEQVTGQSLYQARIPNAKIREMVPFLVYAAKDWAFVRHNDFGLPGLTRMFIAHAEAGHDLIAG